MEQTTLSQYVKAMRKQYNLTQMDLSEKSGVGLRFVRELEQGKQTLRLDKVNQILNLFGAEVGAVPLLQELNNCKLSFLFPLFCFVHMHPTHIPHTDTKHTRTPVSLTSLALAGGFFTISTTWEALYCY